MNSYRTPGIQNLAPGVRLRLAGILGLEVL